MLLRLCFVHLALFAAPSMTWAQMELSLYSGAQRANPSEVTIRKSMSGQARFHFLPDGQSHTFPDYYGLRATRWHNESFGFGVDFAHSKASAVNTAGPDGDDVPLFPDGINTLTLNAYRRWNVAGRVSPYIGGGVGIAVPPIEINKDALDADRYQAGGPAATWIAGAQVPVTEQLSIFGEYKGMISANRAEFEDGGSLETEVLTNALNFGVSFNF